MRVVELQEEMDKHKLRMEQAEAEREKIRARRHKKEAKHLQKLDAKRQEKLDAEKKAKEDEERRAKELEELRNKCERDVTVTPSRHVTSLWDNTDVSCCIADKRRLTSSRSHQSWRR